MTVLKLFDFEALLPVFVGVWARAAVILAVGCVIALALRRASSAARHLTWSLVLVGSITVPALALALPALRVPVPTSWGGSLVQQPSIDIPEMAVATPESAGATASREPDLSPVATVVSVSASAPVPAAVRPAPGRSFSLSGWLISVWAFGVALSLASTALGLVSLARLSRAAKPVHDDLAIGILGQLARQLGLARPVKLLRSHNRAMPMTWGVFKPVILLPDEARNWTRDRLRAVLAHELAHVVRGDCATRLLANTVRALYWFNPLAWYAELRLRAEQERASDDLALRVGVGACEYAEHLLAVTTGRASVGFGAAVALAMGTPQRMELRLQSILDPDRDRRPTTRRQVLLASAVAAALAVPLAAGRLEAAAPATDDAAANQPGKAQPDAAEGGGETPAELLGKVRELYVKPTDESKLTQGAIQGMIAALDDPYSTYFAPDKVAEFDRAVGAKLTGIGAQLEMKDDRVTVVAPIEGAPAQKAGIVSGDVIVEVDGKPTAGSDIGDVVRKIIGPSGTVVKLKVRRTNGKEETLDITRGSIEVPTVLGIRKRKEGGSDFMLDPTRKFGYARVTQFSKETARDLEKAIKTLQADGLKGMILDLRSCPGGMLDGATGVANLFLANGKIVTIRGRTNGDQTLEADGKSTLGDFPLVVIADDHTASAAEIVTGALKDSGRALVVGTRTYGKGSVQTMIALKGGGAIRLTTAYFFSPSGRSIDRQSGKTVWGIDPSEGDYVAVSPEQAKRRDEMLRTGSFPLPAQPGAELTAASIEKDADDPQLAAALSALIAKVTTGEYAHVGKPLPDFTAQAIQPAEVQKRRTELLKGLEKLNHELDELNRGAQRTK